MLDLVENTKCWFSHAKAQMNNNYNQIKRLRDTDRFFNVNNISTTTNGQDKRFNEKRLSFNVADPWCGQIRYIYVCFESKALLNTKLVKLKMQLTQIIRIRYLILISRLVVATQKVLYCPILVG